MLSVTESGDHGKAMAKTTMNVSITDSLKDLAQQQAEKNHFSTLSDYIQHLIRSDVEREKNQENFEAFIRAGLESGVSPLSDAEIFAQAREVIAKTEKRKK